jgi:hypothetical protein
MARVRKAKPTITPKYPTRGRIHIMKGRFVEWLRWKLKKRRAAESWDGKRKVSGTRP